MYSEVKINIEKTKETYGYDPLSFSYSSHKKIIVECQNCNRIISREFRNKDRKHSCPILEGSKKRCQKCGEFKDLSLFNKNPKQSGGVGKMCRVCYNTHPSVIKCERNRAIRRKKAFSEDIEYYIKLRGNAVKSRCKKNGILHNLDNQFLIGLWKNQKGKCYYSNIKMNRSIVTTGFQAWDAPSLDRKSPGEGYVKDNVVWCAFAVNSFKQSLNEMEFKKIIEKIKWW